MTACPRCHGTLSRALKGRHSGAYIRTCLDCAHQVIGTTAPDEDAPVQTVPVVLDVRERMAKFERPLFERGRER